MVFTFHPFLVSASLFAAASFLIGSRYSYGRRDTTNRNVSSLLSGLSPFTILLIMVGVLTYFSRSMDYMLSGFGLFVLNAAILDSFVVYGIGKWRTMKPLHLMLCLLISSSLLAIVFLAH